MGIICETCGRDIDALGQDNMGVDAPLCEDCWNEQQSYANDLRREVRNLRFENARLREKLDAAIEEAVPRPSMELGPAFGVAALRLSIENAYETSRERALALTKLDECKLWLGCCEPKETAAPAAACAAQEAAAPCLKDDDTAGFRMPDVKVEVKPEALAEAAARSLLDGTVPMLRMAVE